VSQSQQSKGEPEMNRKWPAAGEAVPLLSANFLICKDETRLTVEPADTVPKSKLAGETASWGGVRPVPVLNQWDSAVAERSQPTLLKRHHSQD